MPEFRGQNTLRGGVALSDTNKQRWKERLAQFLTIRYKKGSKKAVSRLQQARLANKHHMQATELALKLGGGIALVDFEMKSTPRALTEKESMHFVPVTELPGKTRELCDDRLCRCIYRDEHGKTYTAYKLGVSRRVLHFHSDAG
eukprot:6485084-Amphidinium_carterae.1